MSERVICGMSSALDAPVYIPSRGRWRWNHTHRALTAMRVPHFVIVEDDEREAYTPTLSPFATLLILPTRFQDEYDPCDDLGTSKRLGSGPARNFAWSHATERGHGWHWIVDDNIRCWERLHRNQKIRFGDRSPFAIIEAFVSRYRNIAIAGPHYEMFVPRRQARPPYKLNTRVYSCILIRNDLPFRWRCRYNEDVDLSLRVLKAGWCTVLFNAVLVMKMATQRLRGGNTDAFYAREGTLPKTAMLVRLHPDVSRFTRRWGRVHHYVDYRGFRQRLWRDPAVTVAAPELELVHVGHGRGQ